MKQILVLICHVLMGESYILSNQYLLQSQVYYPRLSGGLTNNFVRGIPIPGKESILINWQLKILLHEENIASFCKQLIIIQCELFAYRTNHWIAANCNRSGWEFQMSWRWIVCWQGKWMSVLLCMSGWKGRCWQF